MTPATREIECAGRRRKFYLFDTPIGQIVTTQVLSGQSYPLLPFLGQVRTIVDIGANVGASAVYFALHYPRARVFAFEPDPESYRVLEMNTADLPSISAFNVGLCDRDARSELYIGTVDRSTNSLGNSSLNSKSSVAVELRDASVLLEDLAPGPIDILKLDAEGSEPAILHALAQRITTVRAIYLEYHDEAARREIDAMLAPTHVLSQGIIHSVHRGELVYIPRSEVPASVAALRIE